MSFFDTLGQGPATMPEAICSRKACRTPAQWKVLWNNPKIHTPERRKVWLACQEHREWLEDYLQQRSFWKETVPFDATGPGDVPGAGGRV
ncbi:hypothetical protein [Arthrobacter sp. NPDC090010]|uniref:hypothetical protein n=1 Tax=Arthrobacter sp. NPDC090010 TaxID=3363942 RepID=UPI0038014DD0